MLTKICGITSLEDAKTAIAAGAWSVGFNFYPASPRYITPLKAKEITRELPKKTITVGIFLDRSPAVIAEMMDEIELSFAQVYEHYQCARLSPKKKIYAIHPNSTAEVPGMAVLQQYAYVLIDSPEGVGGTGRLAKWDIAARLAPHCNLLLAGGLNSSNVKEAISKVKPTGVDVCSGVERCFGIKDAMRLNEFLSEVGNDE